MAVIDFLRFVEINPVLLYFYAFSMLLSGVLGSLFLRHLGQPGIWNYFFSALVHIVSVFGIFSIVVTVYQLYMQNSLMHPFEMLIPFFTMLIALTVLSKRVDLAVITGYRRIWSYYVRILILIIVMLVLDRLHFPEISRWPLSWVLVIVLVLLFLLQRISKGRGASDNR